MPRVGRLSLLLACILFVSYITTSVSQAISPEEGHSKPEHIDTEVSHSVEATEHETDSHHEKFNPGEFMFDHIGDAHDWHIISIGEKHISIPLPIIVYSKEQGLVAFWSTKFHHGHSSYKGFHIGNKGETITKIDKEGNAFEKEVSGTIVEELSNGTKVLPLDISITKNIAALFFSIIIILLMFISVANTYKKNPLSAPKGLQSLLEPVILFVRDEIAKPSIGEKKYESFMPYLLTVFFFIWINNMLGLIPIFPGGANVTGNIAVTMVLAFMTFTITTIRGNKNYWKHIINTPGVPVWLKVPPLPIMPIIETLGIFIKPFVLMVRLFANITAGHIIVLGFLSLFFLFGEMSKVVGYSVLPVSLFFIMFMTLLELLVAFIQAYVFTFLSALYFGMAVEEHH